MGAKFFYRDIDLVYFVNNKLIRNNLINQKDRVLLSFSGGQDSICLLFVLNQLYSQLELDLKFFWCHHLWQTDSFYLMQQIAKLSFLFQFNGCFAVPLNFISSELLARKWRQSCSSRISLFYNYSKICLAHTLNDKVETILLNLMRGTGLIGLSPLRWIQLISKHNITNLMVQHSARGISRVKEGAAPHAYLPLSRIREGPEGNKQRRVRRSATSMRGKACVAAGVSVSQRDTGVSVSQRDTGVSVSQRDTGVSVSQRDTGVFVSRRDTGVFVSRRDTGVSVSQRDTGVFVSRRDTGFIDNSRTYTSLGGSAVILLRSKKTPLKLKTQLLEIFDFYSKPQLLRKPFFARFTNSLLKGSPTLHCLPLQGSQNGGGVQSIMEYVKHIQKVPPCKQLIDSCYIARPFLSISRIELNKICYFWELPIYPDISNQKVKFLRNRVRRQLLPTIKLFFNSNIENIFLQLAKIVETEDYCLTQIVNEFTKNIDV